MFKLTINIACNVNEKLNDFEPLPSIQRIQYFYRCSSKHRYILQLTGKKSYFEM
jgi:hypothetical protein